MTTEMKCGDYQCDECGYAEHNPGSEVCPKCRGQMCYMMTDADMYREKFAECEKLSASNAKLRNALEKIAKFSDDPIATGLWKYQSQIDAMKAIAEEALSNGN